MTATTAAAPAAPAAPVATHLDLGLYPELQRFGATDISGSLLRRLSVAGMPNPSWR